MRAARPRDRAGKGVGWGRRRFEVVVVIVGRRGSEVRHWSSSELDREQCRG